MADTAGTVLAALFQKSAGKARYGVGRARSGKVAERTLALVEWSTAVSLSIVTRDFGEATSEGDGASSQGDGSPVAAQLGLLAKLSAGSAVERLKEQESRRELA